MLGGAGQSVPRWDAVPNDGPLRGSGLAQASPGGVMTLLRVETFRDM
jgi:hypothetical protein